MLFGMRGILTFSGVDLGPDAVELARRAGFSVTQGDVREYLRDSTDQFELITTFDLIEHLRKDELLDLLTLVRSRLARSGRFIIQTPMLCRRGHRAIGTVTLPTSRFLMSAVSDRYYL